MVSEWSNPESSLDAGFHADFFHWFAGYNDLLQKESWRILNGFSEGHSFFDRREKGTSGIFWNRYLNNMPGRRIEGYILLPPREPRRFAVEYPAHEHELE